MTVSALDRLEHLLRSQQMIAAEAEATTLVQAIFRATVSAPYLDRLAFYLGRMHRHEEALACYDRALVLMPQDASLHYNRAMVLRFLGRSQEAETAINSCLHLAPDDAEAVALRTDLRTQTAELNHIESIRATLARVTDDVSRTKLHYALAKELEDVGEYEQSFAALTRGANLRRARMQYQVANDLEVMAAIEATYSKDFFRTHQTKGFPSKEPIFILGMPRVGSTLLERMLASHSLIKSAGELDNFAQNMMALVDKTQASGGRRALVQATRDLDFSQLGKNYIHSTRPLTGDTPYFIDKLPLNFLYVGLIACALPNATIIHIHRNPMDSCYAMYKRLFHNAYPFSYQLEELAQYYAGYQRLMSHWQSVLPDRIISVGYEALISNPEQTLGPVLATIGIDFEPACLAFDKNKSASTTASATQVRQKIYRSSMQKWRHYEQQLEPLKVALVAAGVNLDLDSRH
ncbi:hypothetical protein R50072_11500 [Simiduia litorea]|uniref:tetratricopeptide repeat-containing sulfotransferase family protein n=1 Tax=Simiduia litorea TaxID=1435348 RepID=UPI0036F4148B